VQQGRSGTSPISTISQRLPTFTVFALPPPLTFAAVTPVLLGATFLACWIPSRRVSRPDPMVAPRCK
jgi:ABC-type antimicrobial peptide transport system permease subunit